jgi:hypothetical protein
LVSPESLLPVIQLTEEEDEEDEEDEWRRVEWQKRRKGQREAEWVAWREDEGEEEDDG